MIKQQIGFILYIWLNFFLLLETTSDQIHFAHRSTLVDIGTTGENELDR